MTPSTELFKAMIDLLAADTGILANVTAMKVSLVASNFVPSKTLDLESLTLASFTGSTAIAAGTGTQQVFLDPVSNTWQIQIKEAAAGWTWICTATPESPQVIYGWVLTNGAIDELIGSGLLTNPITIATEGQGISLPYLRFGFANNSPF